MTDVWSQVERQSRLETIRAGERASDDVGQEDADWLKGPRTGMRMKELSQPRTP